jgi:hypothetical protein
MILLFFHIKNKLEQPVYLVLSKKIITCMPNSFIFSFFLLFILDLFIPFFVFIYNLFF